MTECSCTCSLEQVKHVYRVWLQAERIAGALCMYSIHSSDYVFTVLVSIFISKTMIFFASSTMSHRDKNIATNNGRIPCVPLLDKNGSLKLHKTWRMNIPDAIIYHHVATCNFIFSATCTQCHIQRMFCWLCRGITGTTHVPIKYSADSSLLPMLCSYTSSFDIPWVHFLCSSLLLQPLGYKVIHHV